MQFPESSEWRAELLKRKIMVVCILGFILLALGTNLNHVHSDGKLGRTKRQSDNAQSPVSAAPWQPKPGVKWQIQLMDTFDAASMDADIYDIDLFDNDHDTIAKIHEGGRRVICYFSAGTYEDWRADKNSFTPSDLGNELEWPGERWLNLNSNNVRDIMKNRLDLALQKGCDGVDPDNIDAYSNENGLGLTEADSIDFLDFLSSESHSRGMSIGLKNGGDIIGSVIEKMQWSVNEQCAEYQECDTYAAFTEVNKPVFHIEYVDMGSESESDSESGSDSDSEEVNHKLKSRATKEKSTACSAAGSEKFSTIIKKLDLDAWAEYC